MQSAMGPATRLVRTRWPLRPGLCAKGADFLSLTPRPSGAPSAKDGTAAGFPRLLPADGQGLTYRQSALQLLGGAHRGPGVLVLQREVQDAQVPEVGELWRYLPGYPVTAQVQVHQVVELAKLGGQMTVQSVVAEGADG